MADRIDVDALKLCDSILCVDCTHNTDLVDMEYHFGVVLCPRRVVLIAASREM